MAEVRRQKRGGGGNGGRRKDGAGARHIFCNSLMEEINPRDSTCRRER